MHQGSLWVRPRSEPRAERRRRGIGHLTDARLVTGIVLAGGRSIRFGRDKLKEPYRGAPLLHHAVRRVGEACREVVVVVGPGAAEPELPGDVTTRVARDAEEGRGPLAGVLAGLAATHTPLALVAAGDMPDLSAGVLAQMLDLVDVGPSAAVTLLEGGSLRPLPLALRAGPAREAARGLLRTGERRLRALVEALGAASLEQPEWRALDPEGGTLRDIDRPEDLRS